MFNQIDRLAKGLDASWLRQEVIAQNIANAETPDYKSKRVAFETDFQNALAKDAGFQARRTRAGHIAFEGAEDAASVIPTVEENTDYVMRMDGNNVDIDQENVALAENTIRYDLMTTKLNAELARLKLVIREGS
jgi:flagellar basal-body rod protein FlgB